MPANFLNINPNNIDERRILQVADVLKNNGVIIYPTDSVYALACDINSKAGIEKLCRIKKIHPEKALLTMICDNLAMLAAYTKSVDTATYRLLKRNTPGPFTFILKAAGNIPNTLGKRKTIGFRIPENKISLAIIQHLSYPLLSISLHNEEDDIQEYFSDPNEIFERYEHTVDLIIDGGTGNLTASGIVDLSDGDVEMIREGVRLLV
jgi:tRNA threonylcarbamoyl adenosine modification protein (Sua5/YciO/YrdC/YwlC family)